MSDYGIMMIRMMAKTMMMMMAMSEVNHGLSWIQVSLDTNDDPLRERERESTGEPVRKN